MRIALILALLSVFIFGYQNCGSGYTNDSGFFVPNEVDSSNGNDISSFGSGSCYSEEGCAEDPYMLWLKVRESNPYYVQAGNGHFTVAGSCGTGNLDRHAIIYKLRENSGAQMLVGETQGFSGDGRCQLGLFTVPIQFNKVPASYDPTGRRFELSVEIVGLDGTFQPIPNPLGVGHSRIEVIFEN